MDDPIASRKTSAAVRWRLARGLILIGSLAAAGPLAAQDPEQPPAGEDCDACVVERGRDRLCEPHARSEAEVLKEARRGLRSKVFDERVAALRSIADLSLEHANVPSRKAAEALAAQLSDKSLVLRKEAVELLSRGQHHETAVEAVVAALKDAEREWRGFDEVLRGLGEEYAEGRARFDRKQN